MIRPPRRPPIPVNPSFMNLPGKSEEGETIAVSGKKFVNPSLANGVVTVPGAPGLNGMVMVASLQLADPEASCSFTTNLSVATGPTITSPGQIAWQFVYGWGPSKFFEYVIGNTGRYTFAGNFVQVFVTNLGGGASDTFTARAFIVPERDGIDRRPTMWDQADQATYSVPTGKSHAVATRACTLLRLQGYNYGTTADYLQLLDASSLPANNTVPRYVVGYVQAQGTFSLDVSNTGMPFNVGCVWAASTTGQKLTIDNSATFAINCELIPNTDF